MKTIWRDNKIMLTFFAFVACVVTCFVLTNSVVSSASANNTRGNVDYSLATLSEAAAIYVNTMASPSFEGCDEIPASICAGNAGGFVGFIDSDGTDKTYWITSRNTAANTVWSYASLGTIKLRDVHTYTYRSGEGVVPHNMTYTTPGAQGYAAYGFALAETGLDSVKVGEGSDSMRMIVGIAFIILYVLAISMSAFFNLCITMLQAANPFRMFATATRTVAARGSGGGWIPPYSGGGVGGIGGMITSALSDFAVQVGKLYDLLYDMSLFVLIPIFVAVAVFMWLVVKKGREFGSIFKPLAIRIIFLCIGVPFLFAVYGVILDAVRGSVSVTNSPATKVVGSLFCDFSSWANSDDNLVLPDSVTVDLETMTLDSSTVSNIRKICYDINRSTHPSTFVGSVPGGGDLNGYTQYDSQMMTNTAMPKYRIGVESNDTVSLDGVSRIADVLSMLTTYANGTVISAANYEASVAKAMISQDEKAAVILFGTSSAWTNYDNKQIGTFEFKANDGGSSGQSSKNQTIGDININETAMKQIADGRWRGSTGYFDNINPFTDGSLSGSNSGVKWTFPAGSGKALSTMAMYNYLNTQFTSTEIIVSSPTATSNNHVKNQHYAVSMVGSGLMRIVYLLDALCLLACTSIIGYGYGFAMLIGNFKALFKMIPPVLTGMLGSMRGIASAVILTAAMICEVVVTVIMFDISMTIIFAIYNLVELPLATLLQQSLGSFVNGSSGTIVTALLGFISVAIITMLCQRLLQWRHAVVGATTQAASQIINKILGTQVGAPDLDSGGNKLLAAGATVASLGVAAAQGGLVNKESLANLKEKTGESLNAALGDSDKAKSAVNGLFGVKEGELDATQSGDGSSEMFDNLSDSERADLQNIEDNISERGDNEQAKAQKFVENDANTAAFEEELGIGEEDEGNPLTGDATTDDTAQNYLNDTEENRKALGVGEYAFPDGTVTTEKDGVTTSVTKTTTDDGIVIDTVETDANTGAVTKSQFLANNDGTSKLTTDTMDKNGRVTAHEVVDTDANGNSVLQREVHEKGGTTLVEQTVTHDDAGNVVTTTDTTSNGVHTRETDVRGNGGDRHIDRTVTTSAGTTYIHEDHRIDGNGNTVIEATETQANGTRVNTSSVQDRSGDLISSNETVVNSKGATVSNTITNVVHNDVVTTVKKTTTSGGQTTIVNDSYNSNTNTGQSRTVVVNGGVKTTTTDVYQYNQNNERVVVKTNTENNQYKVVNSGATTYDYSQMYTGIKAGPVPSAPKYNGGPSSSGGPAAPRGNFEIPR